MKKWIYIIGVLLALGAIALWYGQSIVYDSNTGFEEETKVIYIPSGSGYTEVVKILADQSVLKDLSSFEMIADVMKYKKDDVPSGKYILKKGMSNRAILTKLRSGDQDGVKVTYNNVRTLAEFAGAVTRNLEIDSITMLNYLMSQETMDDYGQTKETMITLFLPNTYEFFWNAKADNVVDKLAGYQKRFWKDREEKAKAKGMTKEEVYTMASIVEKESNLKSERQDLAGVYINRIKRGIPLQSDPTVVFALQDFGLRRVLNKHLKYDSPYNTYVYAGLPPGPIYMPSINSIESVLDANEHSYLYFCAKPGYNSGHNFARNLTEHNQNARVYHRWLDSQNIR